MLEKESWLNVGVEKVNGGQNICSRDTSVGKGKNLKSMLSPLRVNNGKIIGIPAEKYQCCLARVR